MSSQVPNHAVGQYIDEQRWPRLLHVPRVRFQSVRARNLTQRLEKLLLDTGIALVDPLNMSAQADAEPFIAVRDGMLLDRLVADGWLGLAEGYMAGEWDAEPLADVIGVLLSQPLEKMPLWMRPWALSHARWAQADQSGELPEALVELYAGATRATGSALFYSASRTTTTENVQVRRGRSQRSGKTWPIEISWSGTPEAIERKDLDDAQIRRIRGMLDDAGVRAGDRVLELPSSGGQLAAEAAMRGASVDLLTSDEDHVEAVEARVRAAGVAGAVRVGLIDGLIPSPRQWSGIYDVIFSVERMEVGGCRGMPSFLRSVDRMLAADGVAVIQTRVASPAIRDTSMQALDVMRAYVWPGLEYPTVEQVRACVAEHTRLRITAENHMGPHWAATIPLWRSHFAAHQRQAAAAGFDAVFRRLWEYQLALHETLVACGELDCVQFVLRVDAP